MPGSSHGGDPGAKDAGRGRIASRRRWQRYQRCVGQRMRARMRGRGRPIQPAASAADEAVERATAESEPAPGPRRRLQRGRAGRGRRAGGKRTEDVAALCALMKGEARRHGVPQDFFIRLIHKESRFNPNAGEPGRGLRAIAQFMPATARIRGLARPVRQGGGALRLRRIPCGPRSKVRLLGARCRRLQRRTQQGRTVRRGGGRGLPYETIDYVYAITGTHCAVLGSSRQAREIGGGARSPRRPPVGSILRREASIAGRRRRASGCADLTAGRPFLDHERGDERSFRRARSCRRCSARRRIERTSRYREQRGAPTSHAAGSPRPPHDGTQPPVASAGASAPSDASKAAADASGRHRGQHASGMPKDRTAAAAEAASVAEATTRCCAGRWR